MPMGDGRGFRAQPAGARAAAPISVMENVAAEMLAETLALMDRLEAQARPRLDAGASPFGSGVVLRLSSRLAAVGGWLLTLEEAIAAGETDAATTPDEAARSERRSEMLRRAAIGPLDIGLRPIELAETAQRIDRLVARARRLDDALNAAAPAPTSPLYVSPEVC